MEPLVSIIIPVYNVSPYLREALDSAVHQTYRNLEIILVDDGSTDGSGTICDEYLSDPRVTVIHQENRSLSGARNNGLNHASGEYVAFLDADDAFHPEMIAQLLDALVRNQANLSVCSFAECRTEGSLREAKQKKFPGVKRELVLSARDTFITMMKGDLNVAVWDKLYRRQLWENLRFPEGVVYEDLRTMPLLLTKCSRVAFIPQTLVYYRKREGSITRTNTTRNIRDFLDAYRMLRAQAETLQPPLSPQMLHSIREKELRSLIFIWAELCRSDSCPATEAGIQEITSEIQQMADETGLKQFKTKAAWLLYRRCPWILLPARKGWQAILRIFKNGRRSLFVQ